jgi:predicted metal-dependent phosphoesterase TrpH
MSLCRGCGDDRQCRRRDGQRPAHRRPPCPPLKAGATLPLFDDLSIHILARVTRAAFDLQSHSLHSDGALPAREVVRAAAAAGVRQLALTDHDTVDGVAEALAEGAACGIDVVPAAELSVVDAAAEDVHVLGYLLDHTSPSLLDALRTFRADRAARASRMAGLLRELGFALADDLLERRRAAGAPIGRPHLAEAALAHPANAERLAAEEIADPGAFIEAYLVRGRPAFLLRTLPSVEEAVGVIREAGGVAVWAHPLWDVAEHGRAVATLERFAAAGVEGVEAFYVTHDRAGTLAMADAAERLGLLTTGSSDFHGPEHRLFSRFLAFELYGREPVLGPLARSSRTNS